MNAFLRSNEVKKVLLKVVLEPFLFSLIPILLVMLTFACVQLGIMSSDHTIAGLLLAGDTIRFCFFYITVFTIMSIWVFIMLVKNFKGEDFSSFRIDRFGRQCDFYYFVFGKKIGIVSMENSLFFMFWWIPLAVHQFVQLGVILLIVFFLVSVFLL